MNNNKYKRNLAQTEVTNSLLGALRSKSHYKEQYEHKDGNAVNDIRGGEDLKVQEKIKEYKYPPLPFPRGLV
jgi:hypothetical protein